MAILGTYYGHIRDILGAKHWTLNAEQSKLKKAEGVIRKLYAKSMTLTHDNAQLRLENEVLGEHIL